MALAAFAALLIASGVRATPTVLIEPLGDEFGWGVDQVSLAISINLVLFGADGAVLGGADGALRRAPGGRPWPSRRSPPAAAA